MAPPSKRKPLSYPPYQRRNVAYDKLMLRIMLPFALAMAAYATLAHAAPATPPDDPPGERVKTSDQVKKGSVEGAVTAPLRDLNVMKTDIPSILLRTLEDPYARPARGWKCSTLAALIRPLDAALGPDLDRIPPGDENLLERGKTTALGAAADLASDAIPFRGWVRKLTGAERHDKLVQSAIVAGDVRRAYLKGLGEARGCPPSASPTHERSAAAKAAASAADAKVKARSPAPPPSGAPRTNAGKR